MFSVTVHNTVYKWTELQLAQKLQTIKKASKETHWIGADLTCGTKGCLWKLRLCCCRNPESISGAATTLVLLNSQVNASKNKPLRELFLEAMTQFRNQFPGKVGINVAVGNQPIMREKKEPTNLKQTKEAASTVVWVDHRPNGMPK